MTADSRQAMHSGRWMAGAPELSSAPQQGRGNGDGPRLETIRLGGVPVRRRAAGRVRGRRRRVGAHLRAAHAARDRGGPDPGHPRVRSAAAAGPVRAPSERRRTLAVSRLASARDRHRHDAGNRRHHLPWPVQDRRRGPGSLRQSGADSAHHRRARAARARHPYAGPRARDAADDVAARRRAARGPRASARGTDRASLPVQHPGQRPAAAANRSCDRARDARRSDRVPGAVASRACRGNEPPSTRSARCWRRTSVCIDRASAPASSTTSCFRTVSSAASCRP